MKERKVSLQQNWIFEMDVSLSKLNDYYPYNLAFYLLISAVLVSANVQIAGLDKGAVTFANWFISSFSFFFCFVLILNIFVAGLTRPPMYPFPTGQYPYPILSPEMSQVAASW